MKILDIIKDEIIRQASDGSLPSDLNDLSFAEIEKDIENRLNDISLTTTIIAFTLFDQYKLHAEEQGQGFVFTLELIKNACMAFIDKFSEVEDWGEIEEIKENYQLEYSFNCWDDLVFQFALEDLRKLYKSSINPRYS